MIAYAGIGSRETPFIICAQMIVAARILASNGGYKLRSGNALGADQAFHEGCKQGRGRSEIFKPWARYNDDVVFNREDRVFNNSTPEASAIAAAHHPCWHNLNKAAQFLHARNSHIMLGRDLDDPVSAVLCWTKGGRMEGGTGQALRIALHYDIPVYNFAVYNLETLLRKMRA